MGFRFSLGRQRRYRTSIYDATVQVLSHSAPVTHSLDPAWFEHIFAFNLSDLPSAVLSGYTTSYDQYRINGVGFTIYPQFSQSIMFGGTGNPTGKLPMPVPLFYIAADYDSKEAENPEFTLQRRPLMSRVGNKPVSFFIKPRGLNNERMDRKGQWYNLGDTQIEHLGVRLQIQIPAMTDETTPPNSPVKFEWIVRKRYYVEFMGTR